MAGMLLGRRLRMAERRFRERLNEGLKSRGYAEVRVPHVEVIAGLAGGRAVTAAVLAREAAVSKQAMGELIGELAGWGYVQRSQDAWDKRSGLITLSRKGEHLLAEVAEILDGVEGEYRSILGDEGYEQLGVALEVITRGEA